MHSTKFHEETKKKIAIAKYALDEPHCWFGPDIDELIDEFTELDIESSEEIWPLLKLLLNEIMPNDCVDTNSIFLTTEMKFPDCEIFVFTWDSKIIESNITLKFALNENHFYYLSLKKNSHLTPVLSQYKNFL